MSSRVKNMATLDVYIKVVKNNLPQFGQQYEKTSLDQVAADYVDFLEELLEKTPRPSKDLLIKSCRKVHPEVAPERINSWASKMIDEISHLRAKAKSSTSMTKINPKIKGLVRLMKKQKDTDALPSPDLAKTKSTSSIDVEELLDDTKIKSSGSKATRAEIFAAYGVQAEKPKLPLQLLALQDVVVEVTDSQDMAQPSGKAAVAMVWFDAAKNCMKRRMKDGTCVSAKMLEGDNGFLLAVFDGEDPMETEVPNMVLVPTVMKKPAARKRPAAAPKAKCSKEVAVPELENHDELEDGDDDDDEDEEPAAEIQPAELSKAKVFFRYTNPYVYPNGSVAIRRAGPVSTKQVCSIVSKLPVDSVKSIMSRLTKLLNDGKLSEDDAKQWLKDNVK